MPENSISNYLKIGLIFNMKFQEFYIRKEEIIEWGRFLMLLSQINVHRLISQNYFNKII
jgi:hypothetical protein